MSDSRLRGLSSLHPVVSVLCEEAHRERQQASRREPSLLTLAHPSWRPGKQGQLFDCRPVKVGICCPELVSPGVGTS